MSTSNGISKLNPTDTTFQVVFSSSSTTLETKPITPNKNSDNIINNDIITDSNNDNTKKENILDTVNKFIDKILNDDFLIIALIAIIFYERNKLKNAGTDKNILNDYDMMIAALIYLFI